MGIPFVEVSLANAAAAAAASFVLGMLWYGPLFGKRWIALMKISPQDMQKMKEGGRKRMPLAIAGALLTAYVLGWFVKLSGASGAAEGAAIGVLAWLGFVFTVTAGSVLWEGKPVRLFALNSAHSAAGFALTGAIMALPSFA
jgi:hypothetical protein